MKSLRILAFASLTVTFGACSSTSSPSAAAPGAARDAETDSVIQDAAPVDPAIARDASATRPEASAPPSVAGNREGPRDAGVDGMLLVRGGTFVMGQNEGGEGDERPAHAVEVASFWLDATEVTQEAYDACVVAKACPPPDEEALSTFGGLFRGPNKPVVGVSWFSSRQYCVWRGKRLPTEPEFERAARGDDGRKFPWGNDAPSSERAVFSTNAPADVGSRPAGRGPYGHDDLAGNVWEWLEDDYDPIAYTRSTARSGKPGSCDEIKAAQDKLRAEGKQGFTGTNPIPVECEKAIRGGAYNYGGPGLRSTNRVHHPPRFKLRMTGLRCAKDE